MFDVVCGNGHEAEQFAWSVDRLRACDTCGSDVTRVVKPSRAGIQPDDVPGGFWIENMTAQPLYFRSRSEHRAKMKELGLAPRVRHIGEQGGDRSRHTSRWI